MTGTLKADATPIPERGINAYYRLAELHGWCICPEGITYDSDGHCAFCAGSDPVEQPGRRPRGPLHEAAVAPTAFLVAATAAAAAALVSGAWGRGT